MSPFHIKAGVLRQMQLEPTTALGVFSARPEDDVPDANPEGRAKRGWRQSDVKRAIAAAQQAELANYRVEIAPDGTISIVVGAPSDTVDDPGGYPQQPFP
jgi:hypothetical protein